MYNIGTDRGASLLSLLLKICETYAHYFHIPHPLNVYLHRVNHLFFHHPLSAVFFFLNLASFELKLRFVYMKTQVN